MPRRILPWLFLAGLVAAAYGRSLPYDFVYDDHWTILRNPALKSAPAAKFFTDAGTVAAPASGMGPTIYRPLPTATFAATIRAAGLRPWAWRLPHFALHALNGTILFLLLTRVLALSPIGAALGAAIFLVHPAQTESVVWITQRSVLMCAAGALAALLLASRGSLWATAAYAAALASKETAVTILPFLLLAGRTSPISRRKAAGAAAALLLMTAAYLLWRGEVTGGFAQRAWRGSWVDNLLIGQASWAEYARLIAWPARLTVSHHQFVDNPWEHPAPWVGLGLSAGWAAAVFFLWRRRRRTEAAALAWIPMTLAPHLGILPLDTFVAERFLYFPMMGVGALAGWAFDGAARRKREVALAAAAAACLASAGLAFRRTGDWRNDLTLWRAAVRAEPGNAFARFSLAEAFYARGRYAEAAQATREGITLNPSSHLAFAGLNNLGELSLREGRPGAALHFSEKALRIQPANPAALRNREKALAAVNRRRTSPPPRPAPSSDGRPGS